MINATRPLLIVEDSDEDFEVTCWALEKAGFEGPVQRHARAEEALDQLCSPPDPSHGEALLPAAMVLDLNLPGMNGRELLQRLRTHPQSPPIPVVILSTSTNPADIADCYRLGAAGYVCKPMTLDLYVEKFQGLLRYLFETVTLADAKR